MIRPRRRLEFNSCASSLQISSLGGQSAYGGDYGTGGAASYDPSGAAAGGGGEASARWSTTNQLEFVPKAAERPGNLQPKGVTDPTG